MSDTWYIDEIHTKTFIGLNAIERCGLIQSFVKRMIDDEINGCKYSFYSSHKPARVHRMMDQYSWVWSDLGIEKMSFIEKMFDVPRRRLSNRENPVLILKEILCILEDIKQMLISV